VVPPVVNPDFPVACSSGRDSMTFKFNHHRDFDIPVTEEFLEHCSGKLSSLNISAICAACYNMDNVPGSFTAK